MFAGLCVGAVVTQGSGLRANRSCRAVPLGRGGGGAAVVPGNAHRAVSPRPAESPSAFGIQALCALAFWERSSCLRAPSAGAKILPRSHGNPPFQWLPAAQPGFSLKESGERSRPFLWSCSSLLNRQSRVARIISAERALRVGWLNERSTRSFERGNCELKALETMRGAPGVQARVAAPASLYLAERSPRAALWR